MISAQCKLIPANPNYFSVYKDDEGGFTKIPIVAWVLDHRQNDILTPVEADGEFITNGDILTPCGQVIGFNRRPGAVFKSFQGWLDS